MSSDDDLSREITLHVRDNCLCLHLQRAARKVARRFDEAFRPVGLTNGQFSLLMSLNRPVSPTIGQVAETLAMDRTTLTANLKPLERRGLLMVEIDPADRRGRRISLTRAGKDLLLSALPLWDRTLAELQRDLSGSDEGGSAEFARLCTTLRALG